MNQVMETERRRQALTLFIYYLAQDIDVEKKSVTGIQKLVEIYKNQPDYADFETIEETKLQARQVGFEMIDVIYIIVTWWHGFVCHLQ